MNLLSIDFDFWAETGEFELLDWGFREAKFWLEDIWSIRAIDAACQGKDIRERCKLAADEIAPDLLVRHLVKELKCKVRRVALAESHLSAYNYFSGCKDINLVHIDAHHDMGYEPRELNCDNWLEHLINEDRVRSVTLIYPKWRLRTINEWDDGHKVLDRLGDRVKIEVHYGLEHLPPKISYEKAFICRSGAWVPPWLDSECRSLMVLALMQFSGRGATIFTYRSIEEMFKRKVDFDQAIAQGKQLRVQMETLRVQAKEKLHANPNRHRSAASAEGGVSQRPQSVSQP